MRISRIRTIALAVLVLFAPGTSVLYARGYRYARHNNEDPDGLHGRMLVIARPGHEPRVAVRYWSESGSLGIALARRDGSYLWLGTGTFP